MRQAPRKLTWPYWRMRARAYLLKPVLNWGWLRRRLKDEHHKLNLRPEHRKYLKEKQFLCSPCSSLSGTGERTKFPLGECNLIPISENPQGVNTALVTCPVCSCISFEGRIFDFTEGRFRY